VLEQAGLRVLVVNSQHVRIMPGRKTDVKDCQFLATQLATGNITFSGFVPDAQIRRLQDYTRLRQNHVESAAREILRMQKALERMNLKPHDVIRSLSGMSGMNIIRAIVKGERNPERLLDLCADQIIRTKSNRLKDSLRGTWKEEHLFALRQALSAYDFYQGQIKECDSAIETVLRSMTSTNGGGQAVSHPDSRPPDACAEEVHPAQGGTAHWQSGSDPTKVAAGRSEGAVSLISGEEIAAQNRLAAKLANTPDGKAANKAAKKAQRIRGNTPKIADLQGLLMVVCGGNDITVIPGIGLNSLLQIVSEVGTDLTKWPTAKHFVSWLGLAPGSNQSGKRSRSTRRHVNRAGHVFCMIASSVGRSKDTALGGFYRRLKGRRGAPVANKALARKVATLFWQLMVFGITFVEEGLLRYQKRSQESQRRALGKLAAALNCEVVQKTAA